MFIIFVMFLCNLIPNCRSICIVYINDFSTDVFFSMF